MIFIALITFLIFVFLTYKTPLYSLVALSALLPTYLLRFNIFGLPSTILEIIILAIVLSWLIFHRDFKLLKKRLEKIKWPLRLFFIVSIIAIFFSPEITKAVGVWRAYFLEARLVFLLFLAIVRDKKDFGKIIF